jgi:hypothetical protein
MGLALGILIHAIYNVIRRRYHQWLDDRYHDEMIQAFHEQEEALYRSNRHRRIYADRNFIVNSVVASLPKYGISRRANSIYNDRQFLVSVLEPQSGGSKAYAQKKYERKQESTQREKQKELLREMKVTREEVAKRLRRLDKEMRKFSHQVGDEDFPGEGRVLGHGTLIERIDHMLEPLRDLRDGHLTPQGDELLKQIENVVLLLVVLADCKSSRGFIAALVMHMKTYMQNSATALVTNFFSDLVTEMQDLTAVGMVQQDGTEAPLWLTNFRYVFNNWRLVSTSPGFKYVSRIISLAVAVGLCKASDVELSLGTLKIFSASVEKKHVSSYDLIEAIFSTCNYFVEAGYEAWATQSVRPFLFADAEMRAIDEDFLACQEAMAVFSHGNLALCSIKTEADLIEKLNSLVSRLDTRILLAGDPLSKKLMQMRLSLVTDWRMEFLSKSNGGGLREAPYTFVVWGRSAVGKSTVIQNAITHLLLDAGLDYKDNSRIATINPADKFMSSVRSDTLAIVFDDMGAETPETAEGNIARMWIDTSNNIVSYATKADLPDKGKCQFRHILQVGSSNLENGGMDMFSNYPAASARRGTRDHFVLKPEFQTHSKIDGAKIRARFGDSAFPDIYDITVNIAVEKPFVPGDYFWQTVVHNGKKLEKISYREWIMYHIDAMRQHSEDQKRVVDKARAGPTNLFKCARCGFANSLCACPEHAVRQLEELDHQAGIATLSILIGLRVAYKMFSGNLWGYEKVFVDLSANTILSSLKSFHRSFWSWWFVLIPDCFWNTNFMQRIVHKVVTLRVKSSLAWLSTIVNCLYVVCLYLSLQFPQYLYLWISIALIIHLLMLAIAKATYDYIQWKLVTSRRIMPAIADLHRSPMMVLLLSSGLFLAIRVLYKAFVFKKVFDAQGNLQPRSMADIAERDAEADVMKTKDISPLPISPTGRTIVLNEMCNNVFSNLVYVRRMSDPVAYCNGLYIEGNLLVLPHHVILSEPTEYRIYANATDEAHPLGIGVLSTYDIQVIGTSDLCVASLKRSPVRDISRYLATASIDQSATLVCYRTREGFGLRTPTLANKGSVIVAGVQQNGYIYEFAGATFGGLCGAVLVADKAIPFIYGVHTAGATGKTGAFASKLIKSEYEMARDKLYAAHISMMPTASMGTMPTELFDKKILLDDKLHAKSPLNNKPGTIEIFGSCAGRSKHFSEVTSTLISDDIDEVCGNTQQWGPPAFKKGHMWEEALDVLVEPHPGIDRKLLDKAVDDYVHQISPAFEGDFAKDVKPLDKVEIVSGIDGKRFVDAMPAGTSTGFPMNCPKRDILIDLEPDDKHACPRTFPDFVWDEFRACEERYRKGERCHHIFQACLKDEPTPVGKDKVRIFEAAPVILQCFVRKYFLPIARNLSLFPLLSECAVGINPYSPEWEQLYKYIIKHGEKAILAGDYKKFDLSMLPEINAASFEILIMMAEKTGNYTPDDLTIMRGVATDIVYPTVAYNGDLVELLGSTPSGHNMTVYIGSIGGSLLLRMGFMSTYPQETCRFKDAVAAATYGDDFNSSVAEKYRDFNHIRFKDFLKPLGYILTMPDKTSDPIPFLDIEHTDFLKRHSKYNPDLDCVTGVLVETSIFKSLKAVKKSSEESPPMQSAMNMAGALNEWFYYGRDYFDMRRSQLQQIADRHGIAHLCPQLQHDYDARVVAWKEKYGK